MRSLFLLLGAAVAVDAAVAGSDLFAENIDRVLLTEDKGICADGCVLDDVFYSKTGGACLPEDAIVLTDDQYGKAEPGTSSGVAFDCKGWHPDESWRKPRPDEQPTTCKVRSYADPEDIECPFRGLINSETVWWGEIKRKREQFVLGRHRTTQQSEPAATGPPAAAGQQGFDSENTREECERWADDFFKSCIDGGTREDCDEKISSFMATCLRSSKSSQ